MSHADILDMEAWERHVAGCDLCRNLAELLDRMDTYNRRLGKRSNARSVL